MTSVKVVVRVRPRNDREDDSSTIIEMEGKKTKITNPRLSETGERGDHARDESRQREFTFDHSFWSVNSTDSHFVTQKQIFEALGPDMLEAVYEGYNICVFAYGQTGSGKTFTMMGTQRNPGFIPRFCEVLFGKMKDTDCTYKTQVSFLEIYNEKVRDLLKCGLSNSDHKLRVREHPTDGPYVEGLSLHTVVSFQSIIQLINRGNTNRVTASTRMNDVSSRSHAIFTITFTQAKFQDGIPSERQSKIHLVDLAGSERATVSGSTGVRLKEGGNINKSLVTLGSVISALAEMAGRSGSRRSSGFVPYRDSKLTYLLRDSLGGNAHTIMIATISPSALNYGESLSTLKYANRAKNIINKPTVNEDPNVRLIRELRKEIAQLKARLTANTDTAVIMPSVHEELHKKETRMKVLTDEWTDKWRQAASILQEEQNLELRKEGAGVVLDSSLPHLISLEDDVLSTGVMLYHLKKGLTKIGTEQSLETQDIVISGEEAQPDHCVIEYVEGVVTLHPIENASCSVNGVAITTPLKLNQGALIQLGKSNLFRFNYPEEAERLKQIRKSLSTLSLSKSPAMTTSHTSLLSRSLAELYRSTDSLPLSSGSTSESSANSGKVVMCDSCVNTESEWEGQESQNMANVMIESTRRKTEELEESLKEREREWHEQHQQLEEKLTTKEKELSVLQDCLQIVSQTVSPQKMLECSLKRLEDQEQKRLVETQRTREQLVQALQELGANFVASQSSIKMALSEVENMISARQLVIAGIQKENEFRFKGLVDELCKERAKAEAAEDEVSVLRQQMEEEKNRLLSQKNTLKNAHGRLTQAIERLHEEHRQLDREKNSHWNLTLCCLQDCTPDKEQAEQPSTEPDTSLNEADPKDRLNNKEQDTDSNNLIHNLQLRLKAAEDSFGSTSPPPALQKVKSEMELWINQKDGELRRLEKKRHNLLQSHSKSMAALSQQAEAKETELNVQREKCKQLKKTLQALHSQVSQGVEELQEEQQQLQDLKERKVQESIDMAAEKAQQEEEIENRMKELQETTDAEMNKIQTERERLLGLQRCMSLAGDDAAAALNGGGDDMASSFSEDSAASEILLEKQRELEKKTQECRDLREKIAALEQDLTTSKGQHSDQHQVRLYNVELEKQLCLKALVDQEVRLRLFVENLERHEQRQEERAQRRAERDREIRAIKQSHEKELNDLRATLSNDDVQSLSTQTQTPSSSVSYRQKLVMQLSGVVPPSAVEISIPHYGLHGSGPSSYYEYEVKIQIGAEMWSVFRRYSRFRELHDKMTKTYPNVNCLLFPKRRLFHKTEKVAAERRIMFERYLQELIQVCQRDRRCPLHPDNHLHLTKHVLAQFDSFFRRGLFENVRHISY